MLPFMDTDIPSDRIARGEKLMNPDPTRTRSGLGSRLHTLNALRTAVMLARPTVPRAREVRSRDFWYDAL